MLQRMTFSRTTTVVCVVSADDWGGDVDEDGKARYGVPGPGAYTRVGAFGETVVYESGSAYTFGTKPQTEKQQVMGPLDAGSAVCRGRRSPKLHHHACVLTGLCPHSQPYISRQHSKQVSGQDSPGPIYAPHLRGTRPDLTRPIAFSTGTREGEGKKWISGEHISVLAQIGRAHV